MCEKNYKKTNNKKNHLLENLKMLQGLYKTLVFLQLAKEFYKLPEITCNNLNYHKDNIFIIIFIF